MYLLELCKDINLPLQNYDIVTTNLSLAVSGVGELIKNDLFTCS